LFAFLLSPVLQPTPESLQLYNTSCVALLVVSIYLAARTLGAGPARSVLATLVVFIPDTLYWWSGGLLDWQRDPSFLCLLAASFFLFFAYLGQPTIFRAVGFGVSAGLTLISRDSSLPTLLLMFTGLYAATVVRACLRGELKSIFVELSLPLVVAAPFILYFVLFQLKPTIARLGNPFIAFAIGADVGTSFRGNWAVPIYMMVGPPNDLGLVVDPNVILYSGLGISALLAWAVGHQHAIIQRRMLTAMLAGALWVAVATMILLICVYGLRPLSFGSIKHAFYPVLILPLVALFGTVLLIPTGDRYVSSCISVLAVTLLAYSAQARVLLKTPIEERGLINSIPDLQGIAAAGEQRTWAFLWHERVSLDVIAYYAAQRGSPTPRKIRFRGPDGSLLDTEIGLPDRVSASVVRELLQQTIIECAGWIVVSTQSELYNNPKHPLFLYQHGKPLVDDILQKFSEFIIFRFSVAGAPIVVIDNIRARSCGT
jgi:hypothetical protein